MSYADTYAEIGLSSEAMGATPWQQVNLLLDKLLNCLNISEQAISDKNIPLKCEKILRAEDIVIYLHECLNPEVDEELFRRLNGIYLHLQNLLFLINAKNDHTKLAEAKEITNNLITWWKHAKD